MRTSFVAFLLLVLLSTIAGAADRPEYLDSFDPAKGFKPAQRDLTEVFLQLAGSLEAYGSPVPYLRHVAAEHQRIENLYRQRSGKEPTSFRPSYLTDEYINKLAENWDLLSPKLGLDPLAKDTGNSMRDAIKGTRGTGTILVDIFNRHQAKVFDAMTGKRSEGADFGALRSELCTRLELNKAKVSEQGYEIPRRDAVAFSLNIEAIVKKLYDRLDHALKPADATRVKTYITSVFMDVGTAAHSELQAGISEWAFGSLSTARK